jgi:hypothetical protein
MTRVNETTTTEEVTTAAVTETIVESMNCPEGHTNFTVSKNGKKAELSYNFGQDLASMVELFGEGVVFDQALANMIVRAQAVTRTKVGNGESGSAILAVWKPGVKLTAAPRDPEKDALAFLNGVSEEKLQEMLAQLQKG